MEIAMDKAFKELKRKYRTGEALEEIRSVIRYDLGKQKKTRLKIAGVANSGSLLHNDISKKHAEKLAVELKARAKKIGSEANERFRFVTILQSLVNPTIASVSIEVERLEAQFDTIFGEEGLWSRGTIELELINLSILERISKARNVEARKLNVLNSIGDKEDYFGLLIPASKSDTKVLVHAHVVVDFGKDHEATKLKIDNKIDVSGYWNQPFQKEIKSLFRNKAVAKNLSHIASYVTKGGNDQLRYNAGFGRDLAEDLEAKIWRAGLGRKDKGGETIEDERGLTVQEVKALDELYVWLMERRKDKRGYIISTSGR
jgi:hypothetical protein